MSNTDFPSDAQKVATNGIRREPFDFCAAITHIRDCAKKEALIDINPVGRFPRMAASLLLSAWHAQVTDDCARSAFLPQHKLARAICGELHSNPDVPVHRWCGPAMIHRVPNGEAIAAGVDTGDLVPLWWHYVGLAEAAIQGAAANAIAITPR